MKLTLDPGAAALLDALHAAGYAAYAVGGCVRDSLLGHTAHDWDLCTSALPQQVMELFGAEQCIPTGLQQIRRAAVRDYHLPHRGKLYRWPSPGRSAVRTGRAGGSCPAGFYHQRHGI